jgi:hypothetical protein
MIYLLYMTIDKEEQETPFALTYLGRELLHSLARSSSVSVRSHMPAKLDMGLL